MHIFTAGLKEPIQRESKWRIKVEDCGHTNRKNDNGDDGAIRGNEGGIDKEARGEQGIYDRNNRG